MNKERFAALADAYGGDIRRWPAAERAAAEAWRAAAPDATARVLADAGDTDALLWASPTPMASPALTQRVVALGPVARAGGRVWSWFTSAGVGAALAAACAAGVLVGGLFAPQVSILTGAGRAEPHAGIPDEAVAATGEGVLGWDAG